MRALLISVGVLIVLLVVAVVALPALVPTGAIVARLERTVTEKTGREFAIAGLGGHAKDGAVINPRMACNDAVGFARF